MEQKLKTTCDVVVLTWNRLDVTRKFIKSFFLNTFLSCRLIIIDNASKDGTPEYLSSLKDTELCRIKLILNKENRGYVGGMNQGIEHSTSAYVCLSNNDVVFTKGWLSELISVFQTRKEVGLLNPNSNNLGAKPPSGVSLDEFAAKLKSDYAGKFVQMPFCIGFCMVIRRQVLNKIGGLSEEFQPAFFEDTDYSMKVNATGFLLGMAKASYLASRGNFVWLCVKDLREQESEIFKKDNIFEHSGVKFIRFSHLAGLLWAILKKKKRYSLIISDDKFISWIFSQLGYNVLAGFDNNVIEKIKRQPL